ncbi:MAG: F0F1 ATP synthase subunit delta [Candidatus Omnitrophica bacterium]|nr:F0F1 ATP synthase subunit delta [Candidatus Omnitrophota bacterium]
MIIQLIILQVAAVFGLLFLLRILYKKHLGYAETRLKELQAELSAREAQVKKELEEARKLKLAEFDKARADSKKIVDEARLLCDSLRQKAEEDAKLEKQKLLTQGNDEIERIRKNIASDVKNKALELSMEMLKLAFTGKNNEQLQYQLIDELIQEVENLDKTRITVKSNKIKIVSCFKLNEKEISRLKNTLSIKLGQDITMEESINPDLIAGIIIQIGEFIIDGSLKNKLQKTIPYLKGC